MIFTSKNGSLMILDARNDADLANSSAYYYDDSGGTYTSIFDSVYYPQTSYQPAFDASDAVILGMNEPFGRVRIDVDDFAVGAGKLVLKYYDGSTWQTISHYRVGHNYVQNVNDGTAGAWAQSFKRLSLTDIATGDFKATDQSYPFVLYDEDCGIYRMYFSGNNTSVYKIGYAWSHDGINFTEYTNSEFSGYTTGGIYSDSSGGSLAAACPRVVKKEGKYFMYYRFNDGAEINIRVATSTDGVNFTRYSTTRLDPNRNLFADGVGDFAAALHPDGRILIIVKETGTNDIFLMESEDGVNFSAENGGHPIYQDANLVPSGLVYHNESWYLFAEDTDGANAVVVVLKSHDLINWVQTNTSLGAGDPYPIVADTGVTDCRQASALIINGRPVVYYSHNNTTNRRIKIAIVNFETEVSCFCHSGYISFEIPRTWQKGGHANLVSTHYNLKIQTENDPTYSPKFSRLYPVKGQQHRVLFDMGTVSGPLGNNRTEETPVLHRGRFGGKLAGDTGDVHHISATDSRIFEPQDVGFEIMTHDTNNSEDIVRALTCGAPSFALWNRAGRTTKGTTSNYTDYRRTTASQKYPVGVFSSHRATWFPGIADANDYSGNRVDLFESNVPTYTELVDGLYYTSFDGSADYLIRSNFGAAGANVRLTGALTFAAWVYVTNTATVKTICAKSGNDSGNKAFSFFIDADEKLNLQLFTDGSNHLLATSTDAVTAATWVHVLGSWDGTTTADTTGMRLYINGVSNTIVPTVTGTFTGLADETIAFSVGADLSGAADSAANFYTGRMMFLHVAAEQLTEYKLQSLYAQEAALLKRVDSTNGYQLLPGTLNPEFVSRNHIGHAAIPSLRGAWLCYDNDAADKSGNALTLTNNNSVTYTAQFVDGYAGTFNGSTQYYSLANTGSSGQNVRLTSACGFSFWVNTDAVGAAQTILAKTDGSNVSYSIQLDTNGYLEIKLFTDSSNYIGREYQTAIVANQWTHYIVSWDGTTTDSTGIKLYRNGSLVTTVALTAGSFTGMVDSTADFTIGATDAPDAYFDGRLHRVFVTANEISADKAWDLYRREVAVVMHDYQLPYSDLMNPEFATQSPFDDRDRGFGGSVLEICFDDLSALATKQSSSTTDLTDMLYDNTNHRAAVLRTPTSDEKCHSCAFILSQAGTIDDAGRLWVDIYKKGGTALGTSTKLMTSYKSCAPSQISSSAQWVTFQFPETVHLEASSEYLFVLDFGSTASVSAVNYLNIHGDNSNAVATEVTYTIDNAGNISVLTDKDAAFTLNCASDSSLCGNAMVPISMDANNIVRGIRFPALSFDGSADYLRLANKTFGGDGVQLTGALTLSAWIKPSTISGTHAIIAKHGNTATNRAFNFAQNDATILLTLQSDTTDYLYAVSNTTALVANKWQHVAATWDGTTTDINGVALYINGIAQAKTDSSSGTYAGMGNEAISLSVGATLSGAGDTAAILFNGRMTEMMIIPRALTAGEIGHIYGRTAKYLNNNQQSTIDVQLEFQTGDGTRTGFEWTECYIEPSGIEVSEADDGARISISGKCYGRSGQINCAGKQR